MCLSVEPVSRSKDYVRSLKLVLSYACKHLCRPSVPKKEGICHWAHPLFCFFVCFEDVSLVEFIYLVFTRTPGGVTVGDSGLRCCIPCLSSANYFLLFVDSSLMSLALHTTLMFSLLK